MTLKDAIDRLSGMSTRLGRPAFGSRPLLVATNRHIEGPDLMSGRPPEPDQLPVLAKRIADTVRDGRFDDIPRRDWRRVPWCLWLKERPLVRDGAVREAYLSWLRLQGRRRAYAALIAAYLRNFDSDDPAVAEIGRTLAEAVKRFDWPWPDRHREYRLFAPPEAPARISSFVLDSEMSVEEALAASGLSSELACVGLGRAAFMTALERYSETVVAASNPQHLMTRVFEWAEIKGDFAFSGVRNRLADNLLLPWAAPGVVPPEEIGERTRDFLLRHLGDPRLHSGRWINVSPDAEAVMKRWLAKASLEQFLEIVDDVASPEFKTHWPYRRSFWGAYDRIDAIEEAWVIFARRGAQQAKSMVDATVAFGQLESGYLVRPNHAVLLLKIGLLTVAEWSENGKCYIWLPGNESTPKLYRQRYARADVVTGSDNGGVIHTASQYGTWQRKVQSFIRQNTGIRLNERDYMLKGRSRYG
jgi:hypothetical protein